MEPEQWKSIFNGIYEVSSLGRVRRMQAAKGTRIGRILNPSIDSHGYLTVTIYAGEKSKHYRVHKLVALAFLGECPADKEVDHSDGNKLNNHSDNLEFVTQQENIERAIAMGLIRCKLTAEQVREIRTAQGSHSAIAALYKVHPSLIGKIKKGQRRKAA